jgi:ABC-type transport system involved in cytochrome bd biosynthesis fused ATPase/permease subunit
LQELDYKRKGGKLIVNQDQLKKYLDQKLRDLGMFISSIIVALVIISVLVVIQTFKASDVFLYALILIPYALILIPLLARGFIYTRIEKNLHKRFAELLEL